MSDITKEQLSAYLDNALSAEERALVDRALASSPDLQKELAQMKRLGDLLRSEPVPEPVESFYDRVMEKTKHRSRPWIQWTVPILGAAAAAMVMVLVLHDRPDREFAPRMSAIPAPQMSILKRDFNMETDSMDRDLSQAQSRKAKEKMEARVSDVPTKSQNLEFQRGLNITPKSSSYFEGERSKGRGEEVEIITRLGPGESRGVDATLMEREAKNMATRQDDMERLRAGSGIVSPGAPTPMAGLSNANKPSDPALANGWAISEGRLTGTVTPREPGTIPANVPMGIEKDRAAQEERKTPIPPPSIGGSAKPMIQEKTPSRSLKTNQLALPPVDEGHSGLGEPPALPTSVKRESLDGAVTGPGLAGGGSGAPVKLSDKRTVNPVPPSMETAPAQMDLKKKTAYKIVSPDVLPRSEKKEPPATEWKGDSSGIEDERQVVIRDAATWTKFWAEHQSHMGIPAPTPAVDFKTRMVVGIFVGSRDSSGYSVQITHISENSKELTLSYKETTPSADRGFLTVMTQPYHLKTVPRSALPVRFIKK